MGIEPVGPELHGEIAAANANLLDEAVLARWYRPEQLGSALARRTFVLPAAQ